MAVDADGNVYLSGSTLSGDFPTTSGAFDADYQGSEDAFVAKLSPDLSSLEYATYLGGSSVDRNARLALDADGSVTVAGETYSSDFPATAGAYDVTPTGDSAMFVAKLSADGSSPVYSTFLGSGTVGDVRVDASGAAFVAGSALDSIPTTACAYETTPSGGDAFVTMLDATGSSLVYSTFLGGGGDDTPGLYDPTTSAFFLKNASGNADVLFGYGPAGLEPLVGDRDGL